MRKTLLSVTIVGAMAMTSMSTALATEYKAMELPTIVEAKAYDLRSASELGLEGIEAMAERHDQEAKTWRPNCGSSCGIGL